MTTPETTEAETGSLRLPVPFFDLLMVLPVTCLVFVAPVQPAADGNDSSTQALEIPIARGKGAGGGGALLPVIPHRSASGWTFELPGTNRPISAQAIADRAIAEQRKIVVVAPPATPLQDFIDIQATLADTGASFALAIKNQEPHP